MSVFDVGAILLALAALFGWVNHRWLRLPSTVGLTLIALVSSLALLAADRVLPGLGLAASVRSFLGGIDFAQTLMGGMLSFLLFSGALHVDLEDLLRRRWAIGLLATMGLLLSTAIVGAGAWFLFAALGMDVPWLPCLLFGALISPTDPVAVLGILKTAGASRSLEAKIAGESLFNDGVGVVVFLGLVATAGLGGGHAPHGAGGIVLLFLREVMGGGMLGLGLGFVAYRALKAVDNYQLEVLITLALVTFLYACAGWLHTSGPLAVVVSGLFIGNQGKAFAMSPATKRHVEDFWELLDEILNALLFLLIGMEVVVLTSGGGAGVGEILAPAAGEGTAVGAAGIGMRFAAAALAVPLVLGARLVAVFVPIRLLSRTREFTRGSVRILTWGGLRGGISVALALSLPASDALPSRDLLLTCTYVVVLFSILVQGLTIRRVVAAAMREHEGEETDLEPLPAKR